MRAYFSYGVAGIILIIAAVWLATGNLVAGGHGPGNGEKPLIGVIEGRTDGPIAKSLEHAGMLAEPAKDPNAPDPALTIAQRTEANAGGANKKLQSVRTVTYSAKAMALEVPLRGRTKAMATVSAVAQTAGIVDSVHVIKGQTVAVGDKLCTLDQGTRAAAVAQAEAGIAQARAGLDQAQSQFDTNASLRQKGLAAPNTSQPLETALSAAKAAVSSAQAGYDNAKAEFDRTEIVAKVAGVVQDPITSPGNLLATGMPCATIVQLDPMLFVGQVPEARIGQAHIGIPASILTVSGQTVSGQVTYVASSADAATRSFPAEIQFANANGAIRDGVTATATVNLGNIPAQLLPQSVLTLNDDGVLGVQTVTGNVVKFYPVQITSDTRAGAWVMGLPAKIDVITVGQEYVKDGETVEATNVPPTTATEGTPS